MNADDLTLKIFLESKKIGPIEETEEDIMLAYGHTTETVPNSEMLYLRLTEDLTTNAAYYSSLIAEYLMALNYRRIQILCAIPDKEFPPLPHAAQNLWKFVANDDERDTQLVTVTVFPGLIMFLSMPG